MDSETEVVWNGGALACGRAPRRGRSSRGASKLTLLVFGLILWALGYAAYHIVPFFYYYYDLKNQFKQVIKVAALESDEEIRRKLMTFIKQYQIPVDPEDLRIERLDDTMRISLKYQEIFYVTFREKDYTLHTFDFDATTQGKFK
jgi:hypothetical protein